MVLPHVAVDLWWMDLKFNEKSCKLAQEYIFKSITSGVHKYDANLHNYVVQ